MFAPFRLAVCNEVFEKRGFAESCRMLRQAGWQGIEIAPFTLAENATTLAAARRKELRETITSEGVEFVGLHWLMVGPPGLHVTTPDREVRRQSWEYVAGLVDLCADLGPNGVMVFGSPQQRGTTGGLGRAEATKHFVDGVASVASRAEERGVTICIEPLPAAQTDVVLTLEEAASIVRQIGSPAVRTMYDSHNAVDETEPHELLVGRYFDLIRHVHVNEIDGSYPRPGGGHDFKPLLQKLKQRGYRGSVSVEVFEVCDGGEKKVTEEG